MSIRDDRWAANRPQLEAAAKAAGIEVDVMVKIAGFESGFNPNARPVSTSKPELNTVTQYDGTKAISSAHGYGQFLNGTWATMIRTYGEKYGVSNAADLTDAQANAPALREDTRLQASMLAEFTRENIERAAEYGGKDVDANVYAMHNLGSGDAVKFLGGLRDNPNARVDSVLSAKVISGNPSLYGDGSITLQAAYGKMGDHMDKYQAYADEATRGLPSGSISAGAQTAAPTRAPRDPMADGVLAPDERGAPVSQLQQQLNALGYTGRDGQPLGTDGSYGPNTRHAVERFQQDRGLEVDGIAGRDTLQALRTPEPHAAAMPAQGAAVAPGLAAAGAAASVGAAAGASAAALQQAGAAQDAKAQSAAPLAQPSAAAGSEGVTLNRAYELTRQFDDVKYGFGDKRPENGRVDCSGWVVRLTNQTMAEVNEQAGRDVFPKSQEFSPGMDHAARIIEKATERSGVALSGAQVNREALREGMIIGEDNGAKGWDAGRFKGIDHITMVVRDPTDGELKISQSRGGEGVDLMPLDRYLDQKNARGVKLFATDPLAAARDMIQEKDGVRAATTERADARAGRSENEHAGPTLRENSRGTNVQALQENLNKLGYTDKAGKPLAADGIFGHRTEEAVKAFQRENGLSVDGEVGPKSRAALDRAQDAERSGSAPASGRGEQNVTQPAGGSTLLSSLLEAARSGDSAAMRSAMSDLANGPTGRAFSEASAGAQTQVAQQDMANDRSAGVAAER